MSLPSRSNLNNQLVRVCNYGVKNYVSLAQLYLGFNDVLLIIYVLNFCRQHLTYTFRSRANIYQITLDMFSGKRTCLQVMFTLLVSDFNKNCNQLPYINEILQSQMS
jgi:hypothetical protein